MSDGDQAESRPPRVFISYSHDSPAHCDRVLELAQQLKRDGIDTELDQFHQEELLHWPRWCEEQLRPDKSDFVLCVCTGAYKRRIEGRAPAEVGKGVFREGTLIYNYLYDEKGNRRCVPVLLDESGEIDIPEVLDGYTRFHVKNFGIDDAQSGYSKLYRLVTGQGGVEAAGLGEIQRLPPLPEEVRRTDFTELISQILRGIGEVRCDTGEILSILKDRAPEPSTPGRPHNLPPWMAPEFFIGRGEELRAICNGLTAPEGGALAVVQPHVVRGGGGIGKTRLAIQAVWVLYLERRCDMAFQVSASSPGELDMQLGALAEKSLLDLYEGREPPRELEARRQDVVHALRAAAPRWVLVIDGADSEAARDAVKNLLKELSGGRFLITSRRDDWPKGIVRKLSLGLFTPEEARACLVSRYWKPKPPARELADLDRVAGELGFLPLALALAASYMESRSIGPAQYLAAWKEKRDALLDFSAEDVDYDRSLLAAFTVSFGQLDPPAAVLLGLLAWLAPEPFPRALVEDSPLSDAISAVKGKDAKQTGAVEALVQLKRLSLIDLDEESLRIHKLVLECTRAVLPGETRGGLFEAALTWLTKSLPAVDYDEAGWALWGRLAPHLDSIARTAGELGVRNETLGLLCNQYGLWLYRQARHSAAEPRMRRALAIAEECYGPEHPKVATAHSNLAQLLQDTNRMGDAEPLMRRALAIDEKSYGPEHPQVAIHLGNLAQLLNDTNRMGDAEPLMRRALAIDEKSCGPEHPKVATDLNNLAVLFWATNRLGEAEPLMRRGLAINEKSYGPEHPVVATDLNNLACLLQDANRLGEAEPQLRRALAIDEKSYGPEHPNVAVDLNNLAQLLRATNRLSEAEPLMRRGLLILLKFTRATGHAHPRLRAAFWNWTRIRACGRLSGTG
jgi:tetratricopeptide (TPR) repeat protein